MKKNAIAIFTIGLILSVCGQMFVIMHWPYGRVIRIIGLSVVIIAFLSTYSNSKPDKKSK
ncbi:hypothetical protein GCM10007424_21320 [Flavobacterium suaedae]|uniref:Gliding motility protein GldL n=1 Tax=Flavobacterium suaedae TaxID=1767027 RepID=A0ABQ1JX27_9FLAO|nr:hypothetical protein GCM10007424_21320 [Flavobacterium suaedae]